MRGAEHQEIAEYAIALRGDPCSYCGGPGGCADHVEPLARGGEHAVSNLTAACRRCNARKHVRPLLHFLLEAA